MTADSATESTTRVVTITWRQDRILRAARAILDAGSYRATVSAISHATGIGNHTVRSELAALRRLRLLPKDHTPAVPAIVEVYIPPAPDDEELLAQLRRQKQSTGIKAASRAARVRHDLETAEARTHFEAAARVYERLRRLSGESRAAYCRAHDGLFAALVRFARLHGAKPCVCDGIAYYPDPADASFVRDTHPTRV